MPLLPPHNKHPISCFWSQVLNVIYLLGILASKLQFHALTPLVFLDRDYPVPSTSLFQDFRSHMEADINLFASFLVSHVPLFYIVTQTGNRAKCSFSWGHYWDYHSCLFLSSCRAIPLFVSFSFYCINMATNPFTICFNFLWKV